jgi:hypothetical protein
MDLYDRSFSNNGCSGGYLWPAYQYFFDNYLTLSSVYPYTQADGTCAYSASTSTGIKFDSTVGWYKL